MAFPKLNFVNLLTNVGAFPKPWNRATVQQLHTETQDYINNTLLPLIDLPNNLATNGYAKLPNGLIIQWGGVTITAGANTKQAVNLPIPFPNAILGLSSSCVSMNSFGGVDSGDDNKSTVKCWANNNGAVIKFIATGY